jgi:hypothetical protein
VYSLLGIVVFGVAFVIIDLLTPCHLWKQLVEEKNVALAIVVAVYRSISSCRAMMGSTRSSARG